MDPARASTVAPGRFDFSFELPVPEHHPPPTAHRGTYSVVWWDPSILHLDAVSTFGLRRDDLIVKDGDMFAVEDRLAAYQTWREQRQRLVEQGIVETVRVQTATAWAAESARHGIDSAIAAASTIEVVEVPGAEGRPRGVSFGALVHAILAIVPLDADDTAVKRTAEVQARILRSTAEETTAAAVAVMTVLGTDLIARARRSPRVRRETPITWTQADGTLIEGVLDLAFDEQEATVVIDFKTDHELAAGEARYRAQLQKYVDAVAVSTGRKASGILFKL
jgi:ATP-dependent exoDNAse (exonuclease V) beta subunit